MLVLTRRSQESVVVGRPDGIEPMLTVTVLEINGGKVRLGFNGDSDIPVHRSEVRERIRGGSRPDLRTRGPAAPVA